MESKYIVFSGLDSCGKTTQSKLLVDHFISKGEKAVWTREPGSPLISDYLNVRDIALSHKKLEPETLELLLVADRSEHTGKVKELINNNVNVISDRSYVSGLAYGLACGNNFETLMMLYKYAIKIYPDYVFILDMPIDVAEKRRELRGEKATREEIKGKEFKEKVRENFLNISKNPLTLNGKTKFFVIDATKSETEIFNDILKLLK